MKKIVGYGHGHDPVESVQSMESVQSIILNHGSGSTSYQTLYEGFSYWSRPSGEGITNKEVVAYVDTPFAWVGASNPCVSVVTETVNNEEKIKIDGHLLEGFKKAALNEKNKKALILPVSFEYALAARELGYFVVQIGLEPWFRLDSGRQRGDYFRLLPMAKKLSEAGAHVSSFVPEELSPQDRSKIDLITQQWLASRKSLPLGFLNRVETWTLSNKKKYFRLTLADEVEGYLAAIPIPARQAWYLVDLIRKPHSPTGTTELLIIEAMEILRQSGAKEVTLGMSPLVKVSSEENKFHPQLYRIFDLIYSKLSVFYGFKSLYMYKEKFHPDFWEPQYLIVLQKNFDFKLLYSLWTALYPEGTLLTLVRSLKHYLNRYSPTVVLHQIVQPNTLLKMNDESITWRKSLKFLPAVGVLSLFLILFFVSPQPINELSQRFNLPKSYSGQFIWDQGIVKGLFLTVLASFRHTSPSHLLFNLFTLIFFGGLLELIVGTPIFLGIYAAGTLFSNLLTTLFLWPFVGITSERDMGASLGIFACFGALLMLTKNRMVFTLLTVAGVILFSWSQSTWLQLNHLIAMALGAIVLRRCVY